MYQICGWGGVCDGCVQCEQQTTGRVYTRISNMVADSAQQLENSKQLSIDNDARDT